jgi:hypothetical protein
MVSREILNSHPVAHLRKEISKTNIKGASKMKKAELVDVMMKHQSRFSHITMRGKTERKAPPKKEAPKKVLKKPTADTEPKADVEPTRPRPKKEDNLKKAVGISREEAKKMDFFDLMKKLPQDAKRNIGGQVKAGAGLRNKSASELAEIYETRRSSLSSPWKKKSTDVLMEEVAKKVGRIPSLYEYHYDDPRMKQYGTAYAKKVPKYKGVKGLYGALSSHYGDKVSKKSKGKTFQANLKEELLKRLQQSGWK